MPGLYIRKNTDNEESLAKSIPKGRLDSRFYTAFMKLFAGEDGKIDIYGNKSKLKDLDGFPQGLDLENCELIRYGKDIAYFEAGGDWQRGVVLGVGLKDGKLAIVSKFDDVRPQSKMERREVAKKLVIQKSSPMWKAVSSAGLLTEKELLGVAETHNPELAVGIKVEMEHHEGRAEARKIAEDHLKEDPDYYKKLIEAGLVDEPAAIESAKRLGLKKAISTLLAIPILAKARDLSHLVRRVVDVHRKDGSVVKQMRLVRPGDGKAAPRQKEGEESFSPRHSSEQVARLLDPNYQKKIDKKNLVQPSGDIGELYRLAEDAREGFKASIEAAAKKLGAIEVQSRNKLKDRGRVEEKMREDGASDASQVYDFDGHTLIFDGLESLASAVEFFMADPRVMRLKNNFATPQSPVGYRDINMNVKLPNGMISEVQLTTKAMAEAKEEGHLFYEIWREAKALENADKEVLDYLGSAQLALYQEAWMASQSPKAYAERRSSSFEIARPFVIESERVISGIIGKLKDKTKKHLAEAIERARSGRTEKSMQCYRPIATASRSASARSMMWPCRRDSAQTFAPRFLGIFSKGLLENTQKISPVARSSTKGVSSRSKYSTESDSKSGISRPSTSEYTTANSDMQESEPLKKALFIIPMLEKSRKNPKLVPKNIFVTRDGTRFETTVWVLPGEATKDKPLVAQLDMFAEADVEEALWRQKLLAQLKNGAKVSFKGKNGKNAIGKISHFTDGVFYILTDKETLAVKPEDIKEIIPEREPDKVAALMAKASPETRAATEAQLFGAKLEEKPTEPYTFEPRRVKGDTVEYLDYRDVIPVKISLVPEKDILEKPSPGWIPRIDDRYFGSVGNRIEAVKLGDSDYMVRLGEGKGPLGVLYARVGVDVLAAMQDYYLKRAKAHAKGYDEKQAKLYSGMRPKKTTVRMLGENKAMSSTLSMASAILDMQGAERWKPIREAVVDMKQKLSDMKIQIEENYSSYTKGQETSYGDKGARKNLLDDYGVLVKRQNGDEINTKEIQDIKTALDAVYGVYGDRSSMAKGFGLKISHSGKVLMHARNAVGVYSPAHHAIGVTMQNGETGFGFTLAHEWAHFMDNYLGTRGGRHFYASDDWSSLPGQIARTFRSSMAKDQKSDYQNRTCECFARALEQFFATKRGAQAEYQETWNKKGNHPKQEVYEAKVLPLVERFFIEDNEFLKALGLEKSATWSGYKLQGREKLHGMDISIENRKGSVRRGVDKDGHEWKTKMNFDYGYIRGTVGKDKEHLDCVSPDTKILTLDYLEKRAGDIAIGDVLIGSEEKPNKSLIGHRKHQGVKVVNIARSSSPMLRIILDDGRIIETTKGHLHYVFINKRDKEWKRADDLRIGDRLISLYRPINRGESPEYMAGYLYGAYKGDGSSNFDSGRQVYCDIAKGVESIEMLIRVKEYWDALGLKTSDVLVRHPNQTIAPIDASGRIVLSTMKIAKLSIRGVNKVGFTRDFITLKRLDDYDWCRGFLAGLYDTDGCLNLRKEVQICQAKDKENTFNDCMVALLKIGMKGKVRGNTLFLDSEWNSDNAGLQFTQIVKPAIFKKRNFLGQSLKFEKSVVAKIEEYTGEHIAIQTDAGTYIANGFFTHNCYIGPNPESEKVFVVHQNDPVTGKYDEDKVMLGFDSPKEAKEAYLKQYDRPGFFGWMDEASIEDFKEEAFKKANHGKKLIVR